MKNPLQVELERFVTDAERAAGFVSRKRADEIVGRWLLWRGLRGPSR